MEHSKTSITVTLHDPSNREGHRFGINALASSSNGELFTGGRDGTVRCWDGLPSSATLQRTLDEHSDWVNDLVVLQSGILASCSADTTVKLWSLGNNACETIGKHGDYAKCLSFAAEGGMLASAGFDRRLLLWDVQRFDQGRLGPVAGSEGGHSDSICARAFAFISHSLLASLFAPF